MYNSDILFCVSSLILLVLLIFALTKIKDCNCQHKENYCVDISGGFKGCSCDGGCTVGLPLC